MTRLDVPSPPNANNRATIAAAPVIASTQRHQNVGMPSANSGRATSVPSTTATAAPPDTPSTSGDAIGLRDDVCVHAPATPSAAPTRGVAMATGIRRSHTTVISRPVPPPVNTDRTVDGGIGTGPRPRMSTCATAATAPNPAAVTPAATILRSPARTALPLPDGVHEQRRADEGQHDGHLDLARPEHH